MYKIFRGVEDFFNNFQKKDTKTQMRAVKRLVILAGILALLDGVFGLVKSLFD